MNKLKFYFLGCQERSLYIN